MPRSQSSDGERSSFEAARRETRRYHEEFFASSRLGESGTWLSRPQRMVVDAIELVDMRRPVTAYDLGAGVGRHTVPMSQRLRVGSTIIAVDLLPSALRQLESNVAAAGGMVTVRTIEADLADFTFDEPADLVVAFSAIEHLPSRAAIVRLLADIKRAITPGGVVAIGIFGDRYEVTESGQRRAALVESAITSADAEESLLAAFGTFTVHRRRKVPAHVKETRDGHAYDLFSTLVSFIAQRERQ